MNPAELLDGLETTLLRIQALTPVDQASWASDELRRLAVERLWITAGTLADEYRKAAGLPVGVDPWAELYGYRNVLSHALPGEVSSDRVWHESVADLVQAWRGARRSPRMAQALRASAVEPLEQGGRSAGPGSRATRLTSSPCSRRREAALGRRVRGRSTGKRPPVSSDF